MSQLPPGPARFTLRVYYEDTDCMGVVYHANYLRFFERARSEYLAAGGSTVADWTAKGAFFAVYSANVTFKAPARLFDELTVLSTAKKTSAFRLTFDQRVVLAKDSKLLVQAAIDIVCLDAQGNLRDLPELGLP